MDGFVKIEPKIDEGISNLTTESRSYFKCLKDKTDSLISVTSKISNKAFGNETNIKLLKERI